MWKDLKPDPTKLNRNIIAFADSNKVLERK